MADKKMYKLFVYGNLQDINKPKTHWAYGELRHRTGRDAAAKFGKNYTTKVYGQVQEVSASDLDKMDKMERTADYKRKLIKLDDGTAAFVYEYANKDFDKHQVILSGKYTEPMPKE